MRRINFIVLLLLILILDTNYKSNGQCFVLPGQIAVCEIQSYDGKCYIISNNTKREFYLPNTNDRKYNLQSWLHKGNLIFCGEKIQPNNRKTIKSNLILIDTTGNITDRLFEAKEGQYAGLVYPSLNDSLILFTTEWETPELGPLEVFYRPTTINLMKLSDKSLILQLPDVSPRVNFNMNESPWSPDGNQFVYSIHSDIEIVMDGNLDTDHLHPENGIFIYNILLDSLVKIIDDGYFAVWSPREDTIAYISNNEIVMYFVSNKQSELLFTADNHEQLKKIHWTPDGEYLYVILSDCKKGILYTHEKIIKIKDKKVIENIQPKIGLNFFTWK